MLDPTHTDPSDDDDLIVPAIPEPGSAQAWSTDSSASVVREPEFSYHPQSKRAIAAIDVALADPTCTEIDGSGPGRFSVQVQGRHSLLEGQAFISSAEYEHWLRDLVDGAPGAATWASMEADYGGTTYLADGSRLTIFLQPMSKQHITFSLRKHTASTWPIGELVKRDVLDERMAKFLQACAASKVNMLIVGPANAGKTTLLRALAREFADSDRIAVIEQVPELSIDKPLALQYQYQPGVEGLQLSDVLDRQLYNGIDRLIVGEIHMQGLTQMLEVMLLSEGSMSTYHALTTDMAVERMKIALSIDSGMTPATAISYMRQAIDLVVVLSNRHGDRRCVQITEVDWRSTGSADNLTGRDIFLYDDASKRWKATSGILDTKGRIHRKLVDHGVNLSPNLFIEQEDLDRLKNISRRR